MSQSKITPGSNLMWEGSRMMLPEHVEAIKRHQKELSKKIKPEFDEQYIIELQHKIAESLHENRDVTVKIFDEYDDLSIEGIITTIDTQQKRIRIDNRFGEPNWVRFDEILNVNKR